MADTMDEDAPLDLRLDFQDAFLRNELSAERLARMVEKSARCGLPHFSKLHKISFRVKKKLKRDFLRHFKKRTAWVPLFYTKVPIIGGAEQQLPFFFTTPHFAQNGTEKCQLG